jgi:hypothetical protein
VVEVDGVPEGDRVEDQSERAELVLHPVAVAVAQFAFAAVKHRAGEVVAAFLEVAHALEATTRKMSGDCRSMRARSILPRAAAFSGP